jgi:hypothetical protein
VLSVRCVVLCCVMAHSFNNINNAFFFDPAGWKGTKPVQFLCSNQYVSPPLLISLSLAVS